MRASGPSGPLVYILVISFFYRGGPIASREGGGQMHRNSTRVLSDNNLVKN